MEQDLKRRSNVDCPPLSISEKPELNQGGDNDSDRLNDSYIQSIHANSNAANSV